ncbi:MAG: endonuclease/exonuclease/phosphatase family protein [Schleiferiaceae bacterium]
MKKKTRWISRPLYLLNALVAFVLLASYLSYFLSPEYFSWISVISLGLPILVAVNLAFLIFWGVQLKRYFFTSALTLALGWTFLASTYQWQGKSMDTRGREDVLSVMSFNVRSYNQYQMDEKEGLQAKVETFLEEEDPDVLFLQEHYTYHRTPLFTQNYQFIPGSNRNKKFSLGIVSHKPLFNRREVPLPHGPYQHFLSADMVWNGDTVRLMCVHLMSNKLNPKDYEALKDPTNNDAEEVEKSTLDLLARLRKYGTIRSEQIHAVRKEIQESPYPVILGGDFNDPPSSYPYQQIHKELEDAYNASGRGLEKTYRIIPIPLRIDHLFFSEEAFNAWNYEVHKVDFSDHYPISADFTLSK